MLAESNGAICSSIKSKMAADGHLGYTGWAKKPDCFSELITLRWLVVETRVICQNLANFILEKNIKLAYQCIKYSLPNLHKYSINIQCP